MLGASIKEKKKPALNHITADSLRLDVWNVSRPIDEGANLVAQVKNLRLHEKKPLWALNRLLKIFGDLDEEALHVVIKVPPISEHRCLFYSVTLLDCSSQYGAIPAPNTNIRRNRRVSEKMKIGMA